MGRGNGGNGGVNQASLKGIEAGLERLMPRGLGEHCLLYTSPSPRDRG